jgi:steroid delta-isomerase-like uncharacterized protein
MSSINLKSVPRRILEEAWTRGNVDVLDELAAPNIVDHSLPPGLPAGVEGNKQFLMAYRAAFPDLHVEVDDQIEEGDKVVTRWTAYGNNTGPLFGMPATGKAAKVSGIIIDRIVNGKVVESWSNFDQLGMMQQLGVMPMPGG